MLTYRQIEAIHEAMRECENERCEYADRDACPAEHYETKDVRRCFARIRDALAGSDPFERTTPGVSLYEAGCEAFGLKRENQGEIQTMPDSITWTRSQTQIHFDVRGGAAVSCESESDERMVRPEDVAPAVTERSAEDSKITWQG